MTWLRRFHDRCGGRVRLVCLPHAGGAATFFRGWHRHLPGWVDVVAVQYPGRQERFADPCIADLTVLAAEVTAAVTAAGREPVVLFGHSMGALLGYEVAVRLHELGRPPVHLAVSGHPAPSLHRGGTVHRGSDAELVAELRRLGGTDAAMLIDPELLALTLPAVRADFRAVETHRPRVPVPLLDCRVTAYHGAEDTEVTEAETAAWREVTTGRFGIRRWPGDHFYLTPHEPAVVADLAIRLAADDPVALP